MERFVDLRAPPSPLSVPACLYYLPGPRSKTPAHPSAPRAQALPILPSPPFRLHLRLAHLNPPPPQSACPSRHLAQPSSPPASLAWTPPRPPGLMRPQSNDHGQKMQTNYRGDGGFRQRKIRWENFRLSDWCRNFPCENFCATRARPLLKVGQVPQGREVARRGGTLCYTSPSGFISRIMVSAKCLVVLQAHGSVCDMC